MFFMKKILPFILLFAILFSLSTCRTIRELKALAKCEFRNKDFARLEVSGINLLNINGIEDMNLLEAGKMALQLAQQPTIPMNITFNVEVRNNHDKLAALEKLDWILEVDKQNLVNGTSIDRFEVAPNGGTAILPIQTTLDIKKLLAGSRLQELIGLAQDVKSNNQDASRIRLKIKPSFRVAGLRLGYPGYIKVGTTFEGSKIEK